MRTPLKTFSVPAGANARFIQQLNEMVRAINDSLQISTPDSFLSIGPQGTSKRPRPGTSTAVATSWYPFKIYQVPSSLIAVPDADNDWRKVRVRSGWVGSQVPEDLTGSDKAELSYDGSDMPTLATSPAIEIPDGQAKHWFWIELDAAGAHTVEHAVESGGAVSGWPEFPNPAGRIVIGWVDTLTGTADKTIYFNPEPFANRHLYGTLQTACDDEGNTSVTLVSV